MGSLQYSEVSDPEKLPKLDLLKQVIMKNGFTDLGEAEIAVSAGFTQESIENIEENIGKLGINTRGVKILEEIGNLPKEVVLPAVDWLDGIRKRGHIVSVAINGDIRYDMGYLDESVAERLRRSFGDSMVIKTLLKDEDIRSLVSLGRPIFGDDDIEWLVSEAGGHPYVAQVISSSLWDLLRTEKAMQIAPDIFRETCCMA